MARPTSAVADDDPQVRTAVVSDRVGSHGARYRLLPADHFGSRYVRRVPSRACEGSLFVHRVRVTG